MTFAGRMCRRYGLAGLVSLAVMAWSAAGAVAASTEMFHESYEDSPITVTSDKAYSRKIEVEKPVVTYTTLKVRVKKGQTLTLTAAGALIKSDAYDDTLSVVEAGSDASKTRILVLPHYEADQTHPLKFGAKGAGEVLEATVYAVEGQETKLLSYHDHIMGNADHHINYGVDVKGETGQEEPSYLKDPKIFTDKTGRILLQEPQQEVKPGAPDFHFISDGPASDEAPATTTIYKITQQAFKNNGFAYLPHPGFSNAKPYADHSLISSLNMWNTCCVEVQNFLSPSEGSYGGGDYSDMDAVRELWNKHRLGVIASIDGDPGETGQTLEATLVTLQKPWGGTDGQVSAAEAMNAVREALFDQRDGGSFGIYGNAVLLSTVHNAAAKFMEVRVENTGWTKAKVMFQDRNGQTVKTVSKKNKGGGGLRAQLDYSSLSPSSPFYYAWVVVTYGDPAKGETPVYSLALVPPAYPGDPQRLPYATQVIEVSDTVKGSPSCLQLPEPEDGYDLSNWDKETLQLPTGGAVTVDMGAQTPIEDGAGTDFHVKLLSPIAGATGMPSGTTYRVYVGNDPTQLVLLGTDSGSQEFDLQAVTGASARFVRVEALEAIALARVRNSRAIRIKGFGKGPHTALSFSADATEYPFERVKNNGEQEADGSKGSQLISTTDENASYIFGQSDWNTAWYMRVRMNMSAAQLKQGGGGLVFGQRSFPRQSVSVVLQNKSDSQSLSPQVVVKLNKQGKDNDVKVAEASLPSSQAFAGDLGGWHTLEVWVAPQTPNDQTSDEVGQIVYALKVLVDGQKVIETQTTNILNWGRVGIASKAKGIKFAGFQVDQLKDGDL